MCGWKGCAEREGASEMHGGLRGLDRLGNSVDGVERSSSEGNCELTSSPSPGITEGL